MPNTIDTLEDDSQVSSVLESDASELLKTRQLNSRFPAPRRKPLPRWVFAGLGLAFAAMAGFSWWLHARHFESTDDAQIDGHINVVSSRISGTVLYVNPRVENNQYVEAGTLLLELDPNDYQAALEHAKSDLATKEGEARSAGVNVPITNASAFSQLRLAEAARDEAAAAVDSEEANLAAAQHRVNRTRLYMPAPNETMCDIKVWLTQEWFPVWNMTPTKRMRSQIPRRLKPIAPRLFPNNTKSDNCAVWSCRNWLWCNPRVPPRSR